MQHRAVHPWLAGQTNAPARAAPPDAHTVTAQPADEEPQALGDVTVRGRKKIETLKEVPLSISVVSGAELDRDWRRTRA